MMSQCDHNPRLITQRRFQRDALRFTSTHQIIPRVVEVVWQSLHGPQLCLGEPLPRVRTRCSVCWLGQARRCHEEAGQQTHGVLLRTVTCQELVSMKTLPDDLYDTRQSLYGPQLLPLPLLPELAGCALSCPQRHG